MVFLLKAELINNLNGNVEHNTYESLIVVDLFKEKGKNATNYDKELKMHFENPSALIKIYEVELHKTQLNLSERLQKAEELTRRLMYRYDWIQPAVNYANKVVAIENVDELRLTWGEIKDRILNDYQGDAVLNYLEKIEHKMLHQDFIVCPISQYFFYGLIFLNIPQHHKQVWERSRIVEFSEYEEEQFEELVTYQREINNLRLYKISGNTLNKSKTMIHEYDGLIRIEKDADFPTQVDLTIRYNQHHDISNTWIFKLEQY